MRSKFVCLFAAVLFMLLTAVAAVAAPSKVCDLMTQQTAATVFGAPVAPGRVEMNTPGITDCQFDVHGGEGFAEIGVMENNSMGVPSSAMFDVVSKQKDPGHTIEPVSGLGDAASYNKGPDDATLSVLYHNKILIVSATHSKNPGIKAALIQAAKQALPSI